MDVITRVQVLQTNDWQLLAFFNTHDVDYSVRGDHLFVIHEPTGDINAGPGDWLSIGPDGEIEVERGLYELRALRAMKAAERVP